MHMIDESTGRAAIAYRGDTPWHGLGQQLTEGATIDDWREAAGLGYDVNRAQVQYQNGSVHFFPERHVLYRSDTSKPLSVVGKNYQIVQPRDVLEFFREVVDTMGFQMETAGALSDGKRVWALAKVGEGAALGGKDIVRPYLMLATSYDTTMSTIAKFVAERVVCHNTITIALNEKNKGGTISVPHSREFDAEAVRQQLGIGLSSWDRFMDSLHTLANKPLDEDGKDWLTRQLFPPATETFEPTQTKGFKRIMSLFDKGIGTELTEGPTAWRWLNAVTQYVDWERGVTPSSRINSAWFGEGDAMKTRALNLAVAL